jgi:sulfur-oxidizing protein SoxB
MTVLSRREFMGVAAATAGLFGSAAAFRQALAQASVRLEDITRFTPKGQVTLLHLTDLHAQAVPLYFREPSINLGVGAAAGLPPHLTGQRFLEHFKIAPGSLDSYLLTSEDFDSLARVYGRVGGLDRIATLVAAVRAERPGKVLLLDGGDTWQGSWTALQTRGQDMVDLMRRLEPDALTGHWEFTYGAERVQELVAGLGYPFLAQNVRDAEFEDPVFESTAYFERGGVKVAVIGQAFPYTPIANPRWMIPDWSFGIREEDVQARVEEARGEGAQLVVLLSHNGFDVDRKLASRVEGIDVILTGHTHDALPEVVTVNRTLLVASGSNGKFLGRLDLEVGGDGIKDYAFKLMPVLSDVIPPEPGMASAIEAARAPFKAELETVLGRTESLLYRRGNFNGTCDDLICQALLAELDAEIALSPGFRWGGSLPPDSDITKEFVWSQTATTYPAAYRIEMTGQQLKDVLEDVADNLFNSDPYYQQGGDMVRIGGLAYAIDPAAAMGGRIGDMTLLRTGELLEPGKRYVVAGWSSVNEGTEGPPVWEPVCDWIAGQKTVRVAETRNVRVAGL